MAAKKKTDQNTNGNGLRDHSHPPRLKDLKQPKRPTKLQKELKEATREALKALKEEEQKYGTSLT